MINNAILIVTALVGTACYLYLRIRPEKSALHKRNIYRAKKLLLKLQHKSHEPSMIFGILRRTDPFVFEELLLLAFKKRGYRIKRNSAYTGDGGIDGAFYDKAGNKYLLQAKRYRSHINPAHVREFSKLVDETRAAGGFFIHTGKTGRMSYTATGARIKIISGDRLLRLLESSRG